jgi:hypothetical protein
MGAMWSSRARHGATQYLLHVKITLVSTLHMTGQPQMQLLCDAVHVKLCCSMLNAAMQISSCHLGSVDVPYGMFRCQAKHTAGTA